MRITTHARLFPLPQVCPPPILDLGVDEDEDVTFGALRIDGGGTIPVTPPATFLSLLCPSRSIAPAPVAAPKSFLNHLGVSMYRLAFG